MKPNEIPFNKPFIAGKELYYIAQSVARGNIAADGHFTDACARLLCQRFSLAAALMVPSCTAALEMAAMLCELEPGDEVILPAYTFVSTASAFVREGATPVFAEIRPDTMNIDETKIEELITPRTKAIVPVHYAGVACEMDEITAIAQRHGLLVVEDAAQGVHAYYKDRALGSIGDLGTYSFHETKNYICGEGGALCLPSRRFLERAEIIRDKGTNRKRFFRGEVDKYTWVEIGSSYVISEMCCAFLYGQLELLEQIAARRRAIYERYSALLESFEQREWLRLPRIPSHCTSNYHMFYILVEDRDTRDALLDHLRGCGIRAVFHYVPLHTSPMGQKYGYTDRDLPVTREYAGRLLRLPFFYEITPDEQQRVADAIGEFFVNSDRSTPAKAAAQ